MANLSVNPPGAAEHPQLKMFLDKCRDLCEGWPIKFEEYQTVRDFQEFWPSTIILKWVEAKKDFLVVYWGTKLTTVYGIEMTAKYVLEIEPEETKNIFVNAHFEAMTEKKVVYMGGTFDWRDRAYQGWCQATIPLSRNGATGETLSYLTFD